MVAKQLRRPYPKSECLSWIPGPSSQFQLPANAEPGRPQVTAQVLGSCYPCERPGLKSQLLVLVPASSWKLRVGGKMNQAAGGSSVLQIHSFVKNEIKNT